MSQDLCHDLVTGGAGFIGSHLCECLIQSGRHVVAIDDLSTGRRENISHLPEDRFRLVQGDLSQVLQQQPDLLTGAGRVFHLAATVGVRRVMDHPIDSIRNNLRQAQTVMDLAEQAIGPVFLASSSEVYGQALARPLAESDVMTFGPPTGVRWSYGLTKALMEHEALAAGKSGNGRFVIGRLFNTIGPRQVGDYGMVVPRFIDQALGGRPLTVYGDGSQTRCFCDVRDVVRAMVELVGNPDCFGRIFNIGSDRPVTIAELARQIIDLTGSASRIDHVPFATAFGPDFQEPQDRLPDIGLLKKTINFRPRFTLTQTLEMLVAATRPA